MKKIKGQSIAEYAIVIALVSAAIIGMSVYVRRGIQSRLKGISDYSVLNVQAGVFDTTPTLGTPRSETAIMIQRAFNLDTTKYDPNDPSTWAVNYTDVPPGSPGWAEIQAVYDAGIMTGYGDNTFRPNDPISRAQTAVVMSRAMELDTTKYNPNDPSTWAVNYSDVPPGSFGWAEIQAVYDAGIMTGYGDNTFRPNDPCPRDQVAVALYRALGLAPYEGEMIFRDVPPDDWAYGAIGALYDAGIIQGRISPAEKAPSLQYEPGYQQSTMHTTTSSDHRDITMLGGGVKRVGSGSSKSSFYNPNQPMTRAQSAIMLFNAMAAQNPELPVYTGPQIFNDVSPDNWAFGALGTLYNSGIIGGYGNPNVFMPTDVNTRAGGAIMLCRALGLQPYYPATPIFSDVTPTTWGYGEINALAKAGIVSGYGDGTFGPTNTLTRDQWAVMLYNGYKDRIALEPYSGDPLFVDVPKDYWAYGQIGAIYNAGITDGIEESFFKEETTRYGSTTTLPLALPAQ